MNTYKKHLRNFIQFFKRCWTCRLKKVLCCLRDDAGEALRHTTEVLFKLIGLAFILATPVLFLFTPVFALIAMGIEWVKGDSKMKTLILTCAALLTAWSSFLLWLLCNHMNML